MKTSLFFAIVVFFAAVFLPVSFATAVDIIVPDAGFDDHVLSEGGWIYFGDDNYTGAWQSHANGGAWLDYGYYASDGDLPALSGDNKAYGSENDTEDYIYQILDETFIAGATYTFSVWVGQPWRSYDTGWWLWFTGEDYMDNLAEASGEAPESWQQVSLVYTATAADAGNRIGIKMQGAANSWVAFEDVTLSYEDPDVASNPNPANEQADVPRDVVLSWNPGVYTASTNGHIVYLGESFDDVNSATGGIAQTAASYAPAQPLDFGKTYYWRVDEVSGPPDNTLFRGAVWSFTVEPLALPVENIVATSNGTSDAGVGPERTVDGSGLNADDQHSTTAADMWLAAPGEEPLSIQYEFERIHKLHEMLLWNYNEQFELMLGFGIKDVTVEYSENGVDWTVLGERELAQATAQTDYTANTTIDFGGVAARFVKLTVNGAFGAMGRYGLSEVRFLYIPAQAREPQPEDGATDVSVTTLLGWRAGREAVSHEVYLGADADALVLVDTVDTTSYTPSNLEFGLDYFWRIDEVNEADEVSVWEGGLWSFATQEYAVIDDFESYDDEENRIYDTWLDGWVNETGSTVGHLQAPFAETTIVNSGGQSMPLAYDNSVAPFYAEVEKDLGSRSLTGNGADTLRLFVSGLAPGFFEAGDGTILMNAIGNDIWGTSDQFRYAYKTLTGDGSMVARVDSLDASPNEWVKAGVMIRQGTGTGSQHSFMPITAGGGNGASWQGRVDEGQASVNADATDPVAPPYWVRIDRAGNNLTGSISADGETWTQLGDPREVVMTDLVLIGLALTSHNVNQATSAAFSNVSFSGNVTGAWQIAEIGAVQPVGNTPAPVYVALEDSSGSVAVVTHPDEAATARSGWTEWLIPYSDLGGVNLNSVRTIYVGIGDRDNPSSDGTGTIYIDDIGYGRVRAEPSETSAQ